MLPASLQKKVAEVLECCYLSGMLKVTDGEYASITRLLSPAEYAYDQSIADSKAAVDAKIMREVRLGMATSTRQIIFPEIRGTNRKTRRAMKTKKPS